MSKTPAAELRHDVEEALDDVARLLHRAAERVSHDGEAAVSAAATEVTRAAESVRAHAGSVARHAAHRAAREIKEHPIVALTAAITAAATLVGVLAATHKKTS